MIRHTGYRSFNESFLNEVEKGNIRCLIIKQKYVSWIYRARNSWRYKACASNCLLVPIYRRTISRVMSGFLSRKVPESQFCFQFKHDCRRNALFSNLNLLLIVFYLLPPGPWLWNEVEENPQANCRGVDSLLDPARYFEPVRPLPAKIDIEYEYRTYKSQVE